MYNVKFENGHVAVKLVEVENISVKYLGTNKVANNAKKENKENGNNPLFIFHKLNKCAKGKLQIDGLQSENIKELVNRINKTFATKNGFSFACVIVDNNGNICKMKPYKGNITYNQVVTNFVGVYELIPVKCTDNGVIESAKSVLMYHELMQKNSAFNNATFNKENFIVAPKQYTKVEIARMYANGQITEIEFNELIVNAA